MLAVLAGCSSRTGLVIDPEVFIPNDPSECPLSSECPVKAWGRKPSSEVLDDPARFPVVETVDDEISPVQQLDIIVEGQLVRRTRELGAPEELHRLRECLDLALTNRGLGVKLRRDVLGFDPIEVDDLDGRVRVP